MDNKKLRKLLSQLVIVGKKKKWWTKKDNRAYNKKSKDLVKLFETYSVCEKKINGKRTLSENIADLGGLGIALQALKEYLLQNNLG